MVGVMANRITRMLATAADVLARFWPMSKTEEQVLREHEASRPTQPKAPENATSRRDR